MTSPLFTVSPSKTLMLLVFGVANHDIFHWTHEYLYDVNDYRYDAVIDGKKAYLNVPFYMVNHE